jgi:NAD(P) transhydrogenase subunit alpha
MLHDLGISDIYIFILAGFLGFVLISRIPPLLHTPLMSATNAISGISVIGAIAVAGQNYDMVTNILACVAVTCSTINVVGGFLITDRILKMFKKEKSKSQ